MLDDVTSTASHADDDLPRPPRGRRAKTRPAGPPEEAPAAAPDAALEDIAESPPRHANRAPGLGGIERLRDAGHAEGAASTAEFIAMLARRRPAASRWSSSEARTWRSRAGALSATSPAITTKA